MLCYWPDRRIFVLASLHACIALSQVVQVRLPLCCSLQPCRLTGVLHCTALYGLYVRTVVYSTRSSGTHVIVRVHACMHDVMDRGRVHLLGHTHTHWPVA